jgi:hypothetical protein
MSNENPDSKKKLEVSRANRKKIKGIKGKKLKLYRFD